MAAFIFYTGFVLAVLMGVLRLIADEPPGDLASMHIALSNIGLMVIGIGFRVFHPKEGKSHE